MLLKIHSSRGENNVALDFKSVNYTTLLHSVCRQHEQWREGLPLKNGVRWRYQRQWHKLCFKIIAVWHIPGSGCIVRYSILCKLQSV